MTLTDVLLICAGFLAFFCLLDWLGSKPWRWRRK